MKRENFGGNSGPDPNYSYGNDISIADCAGNTFWRRLRGRADDDCDGDGGGDDEPSEECGMVQEHSM